VLPRDYDVVLFYHGYWYPFCIVQLSSFSRATDQFGEAGIKVVAISVYDEKSSAALVEKHGFAFTIGYGADAGTVSVAVGAYVNAEPSYLQSTDFVLDPEGRIVVAVYSSGVIGRLLPDDVLGGPREVSA
jgi:peroxiredoxin